MSNPYDPPFYKPPVTSDPYPGNIPSGQIILFTDASWGSELLTIDTTSGAYPEGYPFSFSGTGLQDHATWIAFNLPEGTVCTLFDNTINLAAGSPPFNPAGAGVPVDLIGKGTGDTVQTVDLYAYGANDRLSGGIGARSISTMAGSSCFATPISRPRSSPSFFRSGRRTRLFR